VFNPLKTKRRRKKKRERKKERKKTLYQPTV